jgi:hypothetical protein
LPSQIVLDRILLASLGLNAIFALLHIGAGYVLYLRAGTGTAFGGDPWQPTTPKQRVLLGAYFALSFAWLQIAALMAAFLLLGNPLGPWLGVIGMGSFAGQSLSMRGNDPVARAGLNLHLAVLLLWTTGSWLHHG